MFHMERFRSPSSSSLQVQSSSSPSLSPLFKRTELCWYELPVPVRQIPTFEKQNKIGESMLSFQEGTLIYFPFTSAWNGFLFMSTYCCIL